jgi:uncharacterized protein YgiM (DUF1202 family)
VIRILWVVGLFLLAVSTLDAAAQQTPVVPYIVETLPPTAPPACPNALSNRLILYERGRVTSDDPAPLNLRSGPRTSFDILDTIPSGDIFFVLEGPRCSEQYAWYRIDYRGQQGWIAEGSNRAYFVELYPPG